MKPLTPGQINRMAGEPARRAAMSPPGAVDFSRPFVPEPCTQLYFTPVYETLDAADRLHYNQLFGLRVNEYIMMLEADLIERLLPALRPSLASDPELLAAVETMRAEEARHFEGFAAFNRACRPDLYPPGRDRFFSVLPLWTRAMFGAVGLLSARMPFALWFLMAMEESAKSLAQQMARERSTETLGPLDDAFSRLHLEHLKDEWRHLHIDALLVDRCLAPGHEGLNAWLFVRMLEGVVRPTRGGSGVKVIRQLVADRPYLRPREEEMIRAVLALRHHRAFQESLFNRRIMPQAFAVFDRSPALAALGDKLVGYDRPTAAREA